MAAVVGANTTLVLLVWFFFRVKIVAFIIGGMLTITGGMLTIISGMSICSHRHHHRGSHVKFARILLSV